MSGTDRAYIAGYLFKIGLIVAVVAGIVINVVALGATVRTWTLMIFMLLGVVAGHFLSTSEEIEKEISLLVIITLGLLVASQMSIFTPLNTATGTPLGTIINDVVGYIATFSAAAIIVLTIRMLPRFYSSKIQK